MTESSSVDYFTCNYHPGINTKAVNTFEVWIDARKPKQELLALDNKISYKYCVS